MPAIVRVVCCMPWCACLLHAMVRVVCWWLTLLKASHTALRMSCVSQLEDSRDQADGIQPTDPTVNASYITAEPAVNQAPSAQAFGGDLVDSNIAQRVAIAQQAETTDGDAHENEDQNRGDRGDKCLQVTIKLWLQSAA